MEARDLVGTPGKALLRLYPRRWRERYGDEFALILRATPPGPGTVLDVVRGALDAHLRAARPGPLVRGAVKVTSLIPLPNSSGQRP